jgi:hypothetical protein
VLKKKKSYEIAVTFSLITEEKWRHRDFSELFQVLGGIGAKI